MLYCGRPNHILGLAFLAASCRPIFAITYRQMLTNVHTLLNVDHGIYCLKQQVCIVEWVPFFCVTCYDRRFTESVHFIYRTNPLSRCPVTSITQRGLISVKSEDNKGYYTPVIVLQATMTSFLKWHIADYAYYVRSLASILWAIH